MSNISLTMTVAEGTETMSVASDDVVRKSMGLEQLLLTGLAQ